MHSYHTRQECITHKQNKHSTDIFADLRREATVKIELNDHTPTILCRFGIGIQKYGMIINPFLSNRRSCVLYGR